MINSLLHNFKPEGMAVIIPVQVKQLNYFQFKYRVYALWTIHADIFTQALHVQPQGSILIHL